jgi:hypothetical protein
MGLTDDDDEDPIRIALRRRAHVGRNPGIAFG